MSTTLRDIPIIDTDTHVVEPPDLWTSRIASKWGDRIPHTEWDEDRQQEVWVINQHKLLAVGAPAMAGWKEYAPNHPPRFSDTDPTSWDPVKRARLMDDYGVQSQILYPNVAVFHGKQIAESPDPELQLLMISAYNDFLVDFSNEAPGRFVPITVLPFWDIDETLKEMERCAANGHKGIAFTQDPTYFGLPDLTDRHWYPMWASAQEKGLPVNFHIASANIEIMSGGNPDNGVHANYAAASLSFFLANARTIANIITGGLCHRFPDLDFVSVESGIGWLPFALEALDWQWLNSGVHKEHPEYDLLPSEYFKRQIYGCFWFEKDVALSSLELLGADNIMYETDYPHPTSMSPGPASTAQRPDDYLRSTVAGLDEVSLRKILHDNAARVYHLA